MKKVEPVGKKSKVGVGGKGVLGWEGLAVSGWWWWYGLNVCPP